MCNTTPSTSTYVKGMWQKLLLDILTIDVSG